MAVAVSGVQIAQYVGNQRMVEATVTFDSSYPANGEAVAVADLGLSRLDRLECRPSAGYIPVWDGSKTAPKIKVFWVDTTTDGAPMAEVVAATDLSALAITVFAYGV